MGVLFKIAKPNCVSTTEDLNDDSHYIPPWTYNPDEGRGIRNPATQAAYVEGISYALHALHRRTPHAALYLDAGHGGWLGWADKVGELILYTLYLC